MDDGRQRNGKKSRYCASLIEKASKRVRGADGGGLRLQLKSVRKCLEAVHNASHKECCPKINTYIARKVQEKINFGSRMITSNKSRGEAQRERGQRKVLHENLKVAMMENGINSLAQILNFDETGVLFESHGSRTLTRKGSKEVVCTKNDSKGGITALLTCAADGTMLPPQLIFDGKTKASLPTFQADNVLYSQSSSHWCTGETMIHYINKILAP